MSMFDRDNPNQVDAFERLQEKRYPQLEALGIGRSDQAVTGQSEVYLNADRHQPLGRCGGGPARRAADRGNRS